MTSSKNPSKSTSDAFSDASSEQSPQSAAVSGNPEDLFKSCLKKAKTGDIESIMIAAACYIEGCGVSKNEKKGFDLFKKAAEKGNAAAQYETGLRYYYGFTEKQNVQKAGFEFMRSWTNGNLMSGIYLYKIYESGSGVSADPKRAIEYLITIGKNPETFTKQFMAHRYIPWNPENKSGPEEAKESFATICYMIAQFYDQGYGVRKNRKAAKSWCEKAAEAGLPEAAQMLAEIKEREEKEAPERERKRQAKIKKEKLKEETRLELEKRLKDAQNGDPQAQYDVAQLYLSKNNPEMSIEKYEEWIEKAASAGHPDALFDIADNLYGEPGLEAECFQCMLKAAEAGVVEAQKDVAVFYRDGKGVRANRKKAIEWFEKAYENGYEYAMHLLNELKYGTDQNEHGKNGRRYLYFLPDIVTVRAELEDFEDIIWREIEFEEDFTLEQLAFSVIASFKGKCEHAFNIQFKGKRYELTPDDDLLLPGEELPLAAEDYFLTDISLKKGDILTLEYDYGSCWTWNITVIEKCERGNRSCAYPRITDGAGAGIVENIAPFMLGEMIETVKETGKPVKCNDGRRSINWDFRKFNKNTSTRDMKKILEEFYEYEDEG